jgi:hypothetical protein
MAASKTRSEIRTLVEVIGKVRKALPPKTILPPPSEVLEIDQSQFY